MGVPTAEFSCDKKPEVTNKEAAHSFQLAQLEVTISDWPLFMDRQNFLSNFIPGANLFILQGPSLSKYCLSAVSQVDGYVKHFTWRVRLICDGTHLIHNVTNNTPFSSQK